MQINNISIRARSAILNSDNSSKKSDIVDSVEAIIDTQIQNTYSSIDNTRQQAVEKIINATKLAIKIIQEGVNHNGTNYSNRFVNYYGDIDNNFFEMLMGDYIKPYLETICVHKNAPLGDRKLSLWGTNYTRSANELKLRLDKKFGITYNDNVYNKYIEKKESISNATQLLIKSRTESAIRHQVELRKNENFGRTQKEQIKTDYTRSVYQLKQCRTTLMIKDCLDQNTLKCEINSLTTEQKNLLPMLINQNYITLVSTVLSYTCLHYKVLLEDITDRSEFTFEFDNFLSDQNTTAVNLTMKYTNKDDKITKLEVKLFFNNNHINEIHKNEYELDLFAVSKYEISSFELNI